MENMLIVVAKWILMLYIIHACSVILHEMGHVIASVIFHLQIDKVCIGNTKIGLKVKKFWVSPIVLHGCVEIVYNKHIIKNKSLVMFFLAGPLVNLIVIVIGILTKSTDMCIIYIIVINVIHFLGSICPWKLESDVALLIKELRQLK